MCRELLRFIDKHDRMVKNVMNSSMFPVLMDSLIEAIMHDLLDVLRKLNTSNEMTVNQMEGIAAFCSGGMINTLRLSMKRGKRIDEEEFIATVSGFLNHEI